MGREGGGGDEDRDECRDRRNMAKAKRLGNRKGKRRISRSVRMVTVSKAGRER